MIPFHPIVSRKKLAATDKSGIGSPRRPDGRCVGHRFGAALKSNGEAEKRGMPEEDFRAPFQACRGAITTGAGMKKRFPF
jgi:hypothetical protein